MQRVGRAYSHPYNKISHAHFEFITVFELTGEPGGKATNGLKISGDMAMQEEGERRRTT